MLFCREFRNVVNRAFLVLIFLVKNLAVLILRIFATMCIQLQSRDIEGNLSKKKTSYDQADLSLYGLVS